MKTIVVYIRKLKLKSFSLTFTGKDSCNQRKLKLVLMLDTCCICTVTQHVTQPRPQGHLCGHGEEIHDPGKGCPNLLRPVRVCDNKCDWFNEMTA